MMIIEEYFCQLSISMKLNRSASNEYLQLICVWRNKQTYLLRIIPTPWEVTLSKLLSIVSDFEREEHLKYKLA